MIAVSLEMSDEPEKIKKVEEEREKVKEMHDEEVFRAADRNVDLVYHSIFRKNLFSFCVSSCATRRGITVLTLDLCSLKRTR